MFLGLTDVKTHKITGFILRRLHAHRWKHWRQTLTFRDILTVQQTGVSVNVILWDQGKKKKKKKKQKKKKEKKKKKKGAGAAEEKEVVSVGLEKNRAGFNC